MTKRVVIIGAGHNGLVCAAYLARAGFDVSVVEAAESPGGLAATHEFAPGYRVSSCAHFLYQMQPEIVRELALARHGLRLAGEDLATLALCHSGNHLRLHGGDVDGIITERDKRGMRHFHARATRFAALLRPVLNATPPQLVNGSVTDKRSLVRIGWSLKRLGRENMREFLRIIAGNIYDLLNESFDSDLIKGTLALDAVLGTHLGPRSANSVLTYLLRQCGLTNGRAGSVGQPHGGMGSVTDAFAAAARHAGATIRTAAPVAHVVVEGGCATGVELDDGEIVPADIVVSNADPHTTVTTLVGARHFDIGFVRRISNLRAQGTAAKLHLALDGLPPAPGMQAADFAERLVLAGDMDSVERAFNPVKYGKCSTQPVLEVSVPTVRDESLAPAGQHVVSATVQYVPHTLDGGWDDAARQRLQASVIERLETCLPGIGQRIVAAELLTPADLEQRYRVRGGHWHHSELALDQFLFVRPVAGASQYALPLPGLYLCGAGAHPGGGVMGATGRNAARELIAREAAA